MTDLFAEHGEQNGLGVRQVFLEDGGNLDAIQSRHDHIKDHQVRVTGAGGFQGAVAVVGLGTHHELRAFFKVRPDEGTDDLMVVGY